MISYQLLVGDAYLHTYVVLILINQVKNVSLSFFIDTPSV